MEFLAENPFRLTQALLFASQIESSERSHKRQMKSRTEALSSEARVVRWFGEYVPKWNSASCKRVRRKLSIEIIVQTPWALIGRTSSGFSEMLSYVNIYQLELLFLSWVTLNSRAGEPLLGRAELLAGLLDDFRVHINSDNINKNKRLSAFPPLSLAWHFISIWL